MLQGLRGFSKCRKYWTVSWKNFITTFITFIFCAMLWDLLNDVFNSWSQTSSLCYKTDSSAQVFLASHVDLASLFWFKKFLIWEPELLKWQVKTWLLCLVKRVLETIRLAAAQISRTLSLSYLLVCNHILHTYIRGHSHIDVSHA